LLPGSPQATGSDPKKPRFRSGLFSALVTIEGIIYVNPMSVQELESAVSQLSPDELSKFTKWFEEFAADAWDREFEADVKAGKLDALGKEADADFEAGRCKPL
jgi:hypothetical protein